MKNETTHDNGDEVWVRYGDTPLKCIIVDRNDYTGYYLIEGIINNTTQQGIKHPEALFTTKEELLKSL